MGTRNLTAVYSDGAYRIAQYGQWDGYPSGQGKTALDFCREHLTTPEGRAKFAGRLKQTRFVTDEEHKKFYEDMGITGEWMNMDQAAQFKAKYPTLDRDMGAGVLSFVANSTEPVLLVDNIAFAGDSLSCEWAYVIDLDKQTFEVYVGFNKKGPPVGERFSDAKVVVPTPGIGQYYQVTLAAAYKLDDLPSQETLERLNADEEAS